MILILHFFSRSPIIVLTDIKKSHLEAILKFIYEGEVDVKQTDMPHIMTAAESLQIKGLSSSPSINETLKSPKKRFTADNCSSPTRKKTKKIRENNDINQVPYNSSPSESDSYSENILIKSENVPIDEIKIESDPFIPVESHSYEIDRRQTGMLDSENNELEGSNFGAKENYSMFEIDKREHFLDNSGDSNPEAGSSSLNEVGVFTLLFGNPCLSELLTLLRFL